MYPLGFNEQGLVMRTKEEKHGILIPKKMAEFLEGSTNVTCGTLLESWQKGYTWMCIVGTDTGESAGFRKACPMDQAEPSTL